MKFDLSHILCQPPPVDAPPVALAPLWSRRDWVQTSLQLAQTLRQRSVRRVALWCDDAAWFACGLVAAWQAEADVLLLPDTTAASVAWAEAEADLCLCSGPVTTTLPVFRLPETIAATQVLAASGPINPARQVWLKTSGSSGQPKVIVKTVAQLAAETAAIQQQWPLLPEQATVMGSVSPQHMYGLSFRIIWPLCCGFPMLREQCVYPEQLLAHSQSQPHPVVWVTSPTILAALAQKPDWSLPSGSLKQIISSGGALPEAVSHSIAALCGIGPDEVYGSSETGIIATRQGAGLWQPFAGARIGVAADGALQITAPWTDGQQQTADAVELAGHGFHLRGRLDRIVKLADKRVSLPLVEHTLTQHEAVAEAVCGIHPQQPRLAALLVLSPVGIQILRQQGRPALVTQLTQALQQQHESMAIPRYWRFVTELPRNAQAKISQAAFQAACLHRPRAPVWHRLPEPAADEYLFEALVPPDLIYFGGHFAGFPLVPGVVQLQWALDLGRQLGLPDLPVQQVENLKFQQFLRPADHVTARIRWDAGKRKLYFTFEREQAACASGRIVYADTIGAAHD